MLETSSKELSKATGLQHRGHGFRLNGQLQESWCQKHELQPLLPTPVATDGFFKPSSCCTLSFCHCSNSPSGQQAFHFHCKLVSLLRPYLFNREKGTRTRKGEKTPGPGQQPPVHKKKPKKEQTPSRKAMAKGFLILKLEQDGHRVAATPTSTPRPNQSLLDTKFKSWAPLSLSAADSATSSSSSGNVGAGAGATLPQVPKSVWFHIGYVNFQTMHFSGLGLNFIKTMLVGKDDLTHAHLEVGHHCEFSRSFEFFKDKLDLSQPVLASFWILKATPTQSTLSSSKSLPKHLVAVRYDKLPPFQAWKGQEEEEKDRARKAELEEERKKKRQRKQQAKRRPGPKGRITKYFKPSGQTTKKRKTEPGLGRLHGPETQSLDIEDSHAGFGGGAADKEADADSIKSISSGYVPTTPDNKTDSQDGDSDSDCDDDDVDDADSDSDSRSIFTSDSEAGGHIDIAEVVSENEHDDADPAPENKEDADEKALESLGRFISEKESMESMGLDGHDPKVGDEAEAVATPAPVAASSSSAAVPEASDSAMGAEEKTTKKDMNPDSISIPGFGEIRYFKKQQTMTAFCSAHSGASGLGRRRSRTTKGPAANATLTRAGQGRPVGALVAWLKDVENHETTSKCYVHPFKARQEACRYFATLPNSNAFLAHERAKAEDEEDEPLRIP